MKVTLTGGASTRSVTVVIPTYNRRLLLKQCLDAIARQTYPVSLFDVIVVDDGSKDGTEDFIREYSKDLKINFTFFKQQNSGPAAARNRGIQHAKGEIIAFTDDDCIPADNWIEEGVKLFVDPFIGGVGGGIRQVGNGITSEFIEFHRIWQVPIIEGKANYLITANAFYRRDILVSVGGFEEGIKNPGGEDPDISMKIRECGYVLKVNENSIVYHAHKESLKGFYKTFYNYGRGTNYLWHKWGKKLYDSPPHPPIRQVLKYDNFMMLWQYYKAKKGLFKSVALEGLYMIFQYAHARGFQKGY